MATPVLIVGWEHGSMAGIAVGNGGNKVVDSQVGIAGSDLQIIAGAARTGSYGARINVNNHRLQWITDSLSTGNVLVAQFWMRIDSGATAAGGGDMIFMSTGATNDAAGFGFDSATGKLYAYITSALQLSTATFALATWKRVELRYNTSANPHTLDWSIDGVAQTQVSNAISANTVDKFAFGASGGSGNFTFDCDDVVFSRTSGDYPLGSHKIPAALVVDPAGTLTVSGSTANFNTFTGSGPTLSAWNATTARGAIDDLPVLVSGSQDGLAQITTASSDYVEIPMTTYTLAGGETVTGLRMLTPIWAQSTTANNLGLRSYNGSTETSLFAGDPNGDNNTANPAWVCKMLTTADFDTQTELDAMAFRVGFSSNATVDVGIHAIYAEVAVKESTSVNVNLTVATFAFSAIAVTATPGLVTVNLTSASFAFSAPSVTATPGLVTVNLTPAAFSFTAPAVTATPGLITVNLTAAAFTFDAPAVTATPGLITVNLVPAEFNFSAPAVIAAATAVDLIPATFAFSAPAVTATPGAVTVNLAPAGFVFDAVPVTATPGLVTVALTPAVFVFDAPMVAPAGAGSVALLPAVFVFDAVPVAATPGLVTVGLSPASFVFSAVAVAAVPGPVNVNLVPAVFVFSAVAVVAVPTSSLRDVDFRYGNLQSGWTFGNLVGSWHFGAIRGDQ